MLSWRTALWRPESDHRNVVHFFSFSEYWCHREGQPREGRDLIMWPENQWEASKKITLKGTNRYIDWHCDSMKASAQRADALETMRIHTLRKIMTCSTCVVLDHSFTRLISWKFHLQNKSIISDERVAKAWKVKNLRCGLHYQKPLETCYTIFLTTSGHFWVKRQ